MAASARPPRPERANWEGCSAGCTHGCGVTCNSWPVGVCSAISPTLPPCLASAPHPYPTPLLRSPVTALPVTQTAGARGETSNLAPIMRADLFAVNYSQEAERLQQGGGGGGGGGRRGRRDAPDTASPYFQSRFLVGKLFKPRPQNVSRGFLTTHPPLCVFCLINRHRSQTPRSHSTPQPPHPPA